jgi:hypothetical protein
MYSVWEMARVIYGGHRRKEKEVDDPIPSGEVNEVGDEVEESKT